MRAAQKEMTSHVNFYNGIRKIHFSVKIYRIVMNFRRQKQSATNSDKGMNPGKGWRKMSMIVEVEPNGGFC